MSGDVRLTPSIRNRMESYIQANPECYMAHPPTVGEPNPVVVDGNSNGGVEVLNAHCFGSTTSVSTTNLPDDLL